MMKFLHNVSAMALSDKAMPMRQSACLHKCLMTVAIMLLAGTYGSSVEAGSIYKWLDNDGRIHYSHTVPPEVIRNEHQRLNNQAVVVEHIEDADVPNMLAELELTDKQKNRRIQKRLLLATYDGPDDIARERDAAMSWLDKEQDITEGFMSRLAERLREARYMYRHISDDQGLAYSTMQSTIDSLTASVKQQQQRIQSIEKKRSLVQEKYRLEVSRYNEAVALSENKQLELVPVIDYSMN